MHALVFEVAIMGGLAGAGLVALITVFGGNDFFTVAFRALVSGGLCFFFALVAARVVGWSVLANMAQREFLKKKAALEQEELEQLGFDPDAEYANQNIAGGALAEAQAATARTQSDPVGEEQRAARNAEKTSNQSTSADGVAPNTESVVNQEQQAA